MGFRLDVSEESVLEGVRSGLISLVMGGLVLVIVPVVVAVVRVLVAEDFGPT
ncbi:hypothetical protein NGTWS0302_01480 [Mycolicibacterium cyprinidarum]|uniref:Uncharacterized protein n=1 Tax=Mycolicibacterium cyprinidarum TaxID=2860311 RepID=A0ABQ4V9M0_9MYCO|nr:hypothetical protein NGTWS0302_01480 [Mycolicibacterium sp. NGTWS0302]GJF12859.1 hypothetical protein NGTWS1702_12330 [Mycolicibacterium sp. NGTWSNA01]